ncbi:nuclear transport factor 2 family protein [Tumidithrix elongata RA019]|uniref:Nuclear transport factor 2 family protein n=1 Tax=Tumidithrix elongata BACA0141 TaxID=2716417 RepID=A0AAW9Q4U4_9CYAN|nr:nuclear transport factor 2 family protein [Tumidithrix elongata RA019]
MLTEEIALQTTHDWIEAWNAHDLDRIMSHYAEGVEFTSPFIVKLLGDRTGTVKGIPELRAYFAKGLAAYPQLKFELIQILLGVDSFIIYYRSVNDLIAAEQFFVNPAGAIVKVAAHYSI